MGASWRREFMSAMGESFGECVCPPVPFDDASPHECCEAIWSVLGREVTPERLACITESELVAIAREFGERFESEPPTIEQIMKAVARTLARWPVGSLEEDVPENDGAES